MLSRFAASALFRWHEGAYWRAYQVGETLTVARITADDPSMTTALHAEIQPVGDAKPAVAELRRQLGATMGTDSDLRAFYAYAQTLPDLWSWVQPLVGLPNFHSASLYEALLFTVIEQHISWTTALKIQDRFVKLFGTSVLSAAGDLGVLPLPQVLAQLTRADLAPLKLTNARLDLLIRIGSLTASGVWDNWLMQTPAAMLARLLTVKGIGPWTAAVAVGRAYGVQPALHDNDVALQAAVNAYLRGEPGRASRAETVQAFAVYGEYSTVVANLLMMRWVLEKYHPIITFS